VELADALGLQRGISGYVYHTVPLALYCWLGHRGNFQRAIEEVIALGGDADSTGAAVGGIAGATLGAAGIPADWLDGLPEWPRSVIWMRWLAERLAQQFRLWASRQARDPCRSSGPACSPETCFS
jgi:ADP-ribosyl-[dinitrogen reductase] hydrolase